MATRTKLLVDHLDAYILEQPSLVNRNKRSAYPVVAQRQSLAESLVRILTQLGLKRHANRIFDMSVFNAEDTNEKDNPGSDERQAPVRTDVQT
jgi:hypothetical protein